MQQIHDNEIDLFKIFQTLWNGKWLIIALTLIAMLIGTGYIYFKKPVYQSKIIYFIDNIPPFYKPSKILADFEISFYSKKNFDDWKKIIGKTSLMFKDFSDLKVVNGFILKRSKDQQLATINEEKSIKDSSSIIINTNQLDVLEDFYNYSHFINESLNKVYLDRAKDELKMIELRYKDLTQTNIIKNLLIVDRFIVSANKGTNVFKIHRPSMPIKLGVSQGLILILSSILGGMIGALYLLISNSISNLKRIAG